MYELPAEHARLEAVLQQLPVGVIIAGASSGELVLANQQVERLLGHPLARQASMLGQGDGASDGWGLPARGLTASPLDPYGEVAVEESAAARSWSCTAVASRPSSRPTAAPASQ